MKNYKYHYVYRITNTVTEMYYYGDRSCNCHPSEDIGIKYFSSFGNKLFKIDQQVNPQDYKYKLIKVFETCREDAKQFEVDLHKKFDVKNHIKFINRANQTSGGAEMTCKYVSAETRIKIGLSKKGTTLPKAVRNKIAETLSNKFDKNKHNSSKKINILNKDGEIMFETFGNFRKVCSDNKLPLSALLGSYRNNGKPIYTDLGNQMTKIKNSGNLCYLGWYAKIIN